MLLIWCNPFLFFLNPPPENLIFFDFVGINEKYCQTQKALLVKLCTAIRIVCRRRVLKYRDINDLVVPPVLSYACVILNQSALLFLKIT